MQTLLFSLLGFVHPQIVRVTVCSPLSQQPLKRFSISILFLTLSAIRVGLSWQDTCADEPTSSFTHVLEWIDRLSVTTGPSQLASGASMISFILSYVGLSSLNENVYLAFVADQQPWPKSTVTATSASEAADEAGKSAGLNFWIRQP